MTTPTNTNIDFWKSMWASKNIPFHKLEIHPMLAKNVDKLIAGREKCRIFFPLCGKALDMAWFASQGHEVVGVEVVEEAINAFFSENNLGYTVTEDRDFKVYESSDKSIRLFCGDYYNFNSSYAGVFNAIWDRGSLVAIPPADRQKYVAVITGLLDSNFTYLISRYRYDPTLYGGPPHFVSDEQLNELFGAVGTLELVDLQENVRFDIPCSDDLFLLTPRKA